MSHTRIVLVLIQTGFNELACTPPNATPAKGQYHTEEPAFFRLAPLILRLHQYVLRALAILEIVSYASVTGHISPYFPIPSSISQINTTTTTLLFVLGVILVIIGASFRLAAFRALGELFTFDLTVHPDHRLVTGGPYSYVRHPAYTGTLSIIAGLVASHLTPGSWLWVLFGRSVLARGCLVLGSAVWWTWMLGVGLSRIPAEERKMQALFPDEWSVYVARVPWWFIPRVV
ncbi:hypothetical protein C8F01DRAFT_1054907 [Mycena amicta]|nr:hypothetical protein C8F01DRAFT_1054907 [Mycena amicta]